MKIFSIPPILVVGFATQSQAAEFILLPDLYDSYVSDISPGGDYLVGTQSVSGGYTSGFVFSAADGSVRFLNAPTGYIDADTVADGVSANGKVVGHSISPDDPYQASIWTADTGSFQGGGPSDARFTDISADGEVLVGAIASSLPFVDSEAFRWTQATGVQRLTELPGTGAANDVSADGKVVVGNIGNDAFLWSDSSGMRRIRPDDARPNQTRIRANAVSADGGTVVGDSNSNAFRWTQDGGMQILDRGTSYALDVSADGSTVVGWKWNQGPSQSAFLWTRTTGMVDLKELLLIQGATGLENWTLAQATAISDDGLWIAGSAYRDGQDLAFLARIEPVPLPATGWFLLSGLLGMLSLSRWKNKVTSRRRLVVNT